VYVCECVCECVCVCVCACQMSTLSQRNSGHQDTEISLLKDNELYDFKKCFILLKINFSLFYAGNFILLLVFPKFLEPN